MTDIIKTWPANMDAKVIADILGSVDPFVEYYFALGRGKPAKPIDRIWWTYQGRIMGSFKVDRVVVNDGSLPRLSRIDKEAGEWKLTRDTYVAICLPPIERLKDRIYFAGFRGWRYFNLDEYCKTVDAKVRI